MKDRCRRRFHDRRGRFLNNWLDLDNCQACRGQLLVKLGWRHGLEPRQGRGSIEL